MCAFSNQQSGKDVVHLSRLGHRKNIVFNSFSDLVYSCLESSHHSMKNPISQKEGTSRYSGRQFQLRCWSAVRINKQTCEWVSRQVTPAPFATCSNRTQKEPAPAWGLPIFWQNTCCHTVLSNKLLGNLLYRYTNWCLHLSVKPLSWSKMCLQKNYNGSGGYWIVMRLLGCHLLLLP